MLLNYLKIALRNIKRHSLRSFIHVIGLSIGIAACFVIYNLVAYEYGFDTFHPEKEKIHRVISVSGNAQEQWPNSGTHFPLAEAVRNELPMATEVNHFYTSNAVLVSSADKEKNYGRQDGIIYADSSYFQMFSYHWLSGNKLNALKNMNSVVLTEKAMQKYFGNISPAEALGKELIFADTIPATVTGVVADFKESSDFTFTEFISMATILNKEKIRESIYVDSWDNVTSSSQLFIKIDPNDLEESEEALLAIKNKYIEQEGDRYTTFSLEPLSELHFGQTYSTKAANKLVIKGLIAIGFFILFIACVNFINLETAQAKLRAKEVGVRKTLGSNRKQLVAQFLTETFLIILLAIIIAIFISELGIAYFKELLPEGLSFVYWSINNLIFLSLLSVAILLLSGFYPALLLSGYSPIRALKGVRNYKRGFDFQYFLRKNLTVLQFTFSIAFIIVVMAVSGQIEYLMKKDVGFNKEAVTYIYTAFDPADKQNAVLRDELKKLSFVEEVSLSSDMLISQSLWTSTVTLAEDSSKTEMSIQVKSADTSYLSLYDVPLLAGRNYRIGSQETVINEIAATKLGFENPEDAIGQFLSYGDEQELLIVGIIKNVHTQSMYAAIRPMMINPETVRLFTTNVKLKPNIDLVAAKEQMQASYHAIYPNESHEFKFLDETVENFYQSELRMKRVLGFATALAILISCLGLFGLSSFTIAQRTKEISIRKVLGASLSNILVLITKEYALLITIAFLLSIFPAWYFLSNWLNSFQYRMELSAFTFIVAGFIAFILSIGIVALHSLKAANSNPAEVLKDE
ncbi:ABC transporter permease [Marivirga sp. S37H4]|uniref:ABC transporter permease n=1 Tax=Marivirga aurantiaca TaxID=2802615 RepID=A0A935C9U1_9BACT|nr:ABC transporter permease [Marivirga aurantiaca]MBK6266366.1 ABC transporter permease [Marivirga aurantiaca]